MERITITVPASLLAAVDASEKNRSRFFVRGARRELRARERAALRRSLDAHELADEDRQWLDADLAPAPDAEPDLLDLASMTPVRWERGRGWTAR